MGVDVPPQGIKPKKKHRVVIELTGPLSEKHAKGLKRELDRVLERYRKKLGGLKPPAPKKRRKKA